LLAATKHYQEKTNNPLGECKKYVDGLVAKYHITPHQGNAGCMVVLLATAASIATSLYFF